MKACNTMQQHTMPEVYTKTKTWLQRKAWLQPKAVWVLADGGTMNCIDDAVRMQLGCNSDASEVKIHCCLIHAWAASLVQHHLCDRTYTYLAYCIDVATVINADTHTDTTTTVVCIVLDVAAYSTHRYLHTSDLADCMQPGMTLHPAAHKTPCVLNKRFD